MWLTEHGLNARKFDVRVSIGDQFRNSVFSQVPQQDLSKCLYVVLKWILSLLRRKTLLQYANCAAKLALAQGHNCRPNFHKSLVLLRNGLRYALIEELGIDKVIFIDQVHQ